MKQPHVRVRVWGDFACFTRPDFKVERVTYPVITPSAARGVLEAIYWKPQIRYEIKRIGICKLGSQMVVLRNEIKDRQRRDPIIISKDPKQRQQRSSLILRDIEYIIEADIRRLPHARDPLPTFIAQATRRIERGKCFHTPYLGTREFSAAFEPARDQQPENTNLPLGTILFDIAFIPSTRNSELTFRSAGEKEPVAGYHHALYMINAEVKNGWWEIPQEQYRELYRLEGKNVH